MLFVCAFSISGLIVLSGYDSGSGNWRLLGLGTCLTVSGMTCFATHIDTVKDKNKMWFWIIIALLIIAIIAIVVESVIT